MRFDKDGRPVAVYQCKPGERPYRPARRPPSPLGPADDVPGDAVGEEPRHLEALSDADHGPSPAKENPAPEAAPHQAPRDVTPAQD